MLILIGFADAGHWSARVEWVYGVSLGVGDWRRESGHRMRANAGKAREVRD